MSDKKTLVIAGASGFIGRWFIHTYRHHYHIIALSRKKVRHNPHPEVEWRQVELYSISSTERALAGAHYALYLVHSMNPSTRLNQGTFDDTDLLLADNFSRAAEAQNLEQIIFMGGIVPPDGEPLSRHLRSRYEVEQTLGARRTPLTSLRAGIIIGPGGSSFEIVRKLVKNLPIMACPKWCDSESQPISIHDTLPLLHQVIGAPQYYGQSLEIGGPDVISYTDLLRLTARLMKKRRLIFSVPIYTVGFSKLWVARFTGSSTTLVSPLVESLRHHMRLHPARWAQLPLQRPALSIQEAVSDALSGPEPAAGPSFHSPAPQRNTVRSFQRLPNPAQLGARRVALLYQRWLPHLFRYLIHARQEGPYVHIYASGLPRPILVLRSIPDRSDGERWLFYICDGLLVRRKDYGWLEFRRVLQGRHFVAAIHEFVPSLPWYIYRYTQALFHLWVMHRFRRYLAQLQAA
jgi:uncharacterized protein YbjT (DUF2867 family)